MKDQTRKEIRLKPEIRKLAYSEKVVPVLHISGVWLEELGFKAGNKALIIIEKGQLIIKPQ